MYFFDPRLDRGGRIDDGDGGRDLRRFSNATRIAAAAAASAAAFTAFCSQYSSDGDDDDDGGGGGSR
jgi:hypothetical protein